MIPGSIDYILNLYLMFPTMNEFNRIVLAAYYYLHAFRYEEAQKEWDKLFPLLEGEK